MTYSGGSLVSGSELEKLHEIVVKNHTAVDNAKKRMEEIKKNPVVGLVRAGSIQESSADNE